MQPVEKRVLTELDGFDLCTKPISFASFDMRGRGHGVQFNLAEDRMAYEATDSGQLHLNEVSADVAEHDLMRALAHEYRQVEVYSADMLKWLAALLRHLQADRPG